MAKKNKPAYAPRKKRSVVPVAFIFVAAAVFSLVAAGIWQLLDSGVYDPDAFTKGSSLGADSSGSQSPDPASQDEQDPQSEPSSDPASEPGGSFEPLVAEGEWLPSSYFDDVLFVGDSITEGIKLYDVMSNAKVLASTGVNLNSIYTKASTDGKTLIELSAEESPGKIYLMMGVNSLLADKETFIAGYGKLVDTLRQQHPDAVFYVQSVLPVTASYENSSGAVTGNAQIDEYNAALLEMCREKQVYYLNVAEVFKDDTGALPNEASPSDGIHFSRSWYMTWFDYLRGHGAPTE